MTSRPRGAYTVWRSVLESGENAADMVTSTGEAAWLRAYRHYAIGDD